MFSEIIQWKKVDAVCKVLNTDNTFDAMDLYS